MRFFFFGTLLDDEVLTLVVGRDIPRADRRMAVLPGYRRAKVDGVSYPIVVPAEGAEVAGMLVSGLAPSEAARLVAYEGADYELVLRQVRAGSRQRQAHVFVPSPGSRLKPLDEEWKFEAWASEHRAGFVARLRRGLAAARDI